MSPETERALRRAAKKARDGAAQRDELIRRAHAERASLREIAAVAGLTHTGVRRILERYDATIDRRAASE